MKKIKETKAEGIYIFQGKSVEGSVFVEDFIEAKKFLDLLNIRLDGFLKIRDYLITKNSWTLLCEIGSEEEILEQYKKQYIGRKCGNLKDVWRILSEQIRHVLSMFVKYTNRKQGRTGGKVHSNYERLIFESETEANVFIAKMKNQVLNNEPQLKRYRSKKKLYRIRKKWGVGHVYLCTGGIDVEDFRGIFESGALEITVLGIGVLRKLIRNTFWRHFRGTSKSDNINFT